MPERADAFHSVNRAPSLPDRVAEQLTQAIVSQKLRPGDLLPSARELAEEFRVSRTVIREAIRSLSAKGLVRALQGRGVAVDDYGQEYVAASMRVLVHEHSGLAHGKINEVRTAVEVQVAGLAAQRATRPQLDELEQLCQGYEKSLDKRDLATACELDFQFHRTLVRASRNELFLAMLDSVVDVLREVRGPSIMPLRIAEAGATEHRRILKCLIERDPRAACQAMADHLEKSHAC